MKRKKMPEANKNFAQVSVFKKDNVMQISNKKIFLSINDLSSNLDLDAISFFLIR